VIGTTDTEPSHLDRSGTWVAIPRAIERDICYRYTMKTKNLTQVLERVEAWPPEAQDAPAEFAGIDRGLRDAEQGRFATDEQVDAAFARVRGA
jgi:predicted transcriptional regulator